MKTDAEKEVEREKTYKKWDPPKESDLHWSKIGFSEWAMQNGDHFMWFKIKPIKKKEG